VIGLKSFQNVTVSTVRKNRYAIRGNPAQTCTEKRKVYRLSYLCESEIILVLMKQLTKRAVFVCKKAKICYYQVKRVKWILISIFERTQIIKGLIPFIMAILN
jgi:hypothetical protein